MGRTSFPEGSLKLVERSEGEVWDFRWREVQGDGSIRRKNVMLSSAQDSPGRLVQLASPAGFEPALPP